MNAPDPRDIHGVWAQAAMPFESADGGVPAVVARCQQGEATAWKQLYDENFDFAWRLCRRLGVPDADVEDAVQEAFVIVHQKIGRFTGGLFTTWLFQIVSHVAAARVRRTRVREVLSSLWGSREEPVVPDAEGATAARQQLASVEQVLRSLSKEKREAFALHELEGLTHEQISDLTGVKVETIRTRLFYARREFNARCQSKGISP